MVVGVTLKNLLVVLVLGLKAEKVPSAVAEDVIAAVAPPPFVNDPVVTA